MIIPYNHIIRVKSLINGYFPVTVEIKSFVTRNMPDQRQYVYHGRLTEYMETQHAKSI